MTHAESGNGDRDEAMAPRGAAITAMCRQCIVDPGAHGTWREQDAALQPVLLTLTDSNPNAANVRFLIEGAAPPADAEAYARIVLLFDGEDDDAVAAARSHWSDAKAKGFEATYWQPDEQGRWMKKA